MTQSPFQADRFTPEAPPASLVPLWRKRWFWRIVLFLCAAGVTAVIVHSQWDPFWQRKYLHDIKTLRDAGDYDAALQKCNRALADYPNDAQFYLERGKLRFYREELDAAHADLDRVLNLNRTSEEAYRFRAYVRGRMGQLAKALEDMEQARKWGSESDSDLLNEHAYFRARANTDLPAALQDVERALSLLDEQAAFIRQMPQAHLAIGHQRAVYLDTRGFIHHLRGDQEKALADMNEAVQLYEAYMAAIDRVRDRDHSAKAARTRKYLNQSLGTLYHHRGLIYEKLGEEEKAKADFARRDELGFDPAKE